MNRSKPLILNIDDDEAGRYAINRVLQQAGFDVLGAPTGQAGLDLSDKHRPDLVLLDIRLPDIDGFEVCRRMRADPRTQGTPVLQMSASYLDVASQVKGLENGADAYLTEPVEPAILVATVKSMLRLKRAENSVRQTASEWQSTFDAIKDAVALLDRNGSISRANAAFRSWPELEGVVRHCYESMSAATDRSHEIAVGHRTFEITLDPVRDAAQQITGTVCVAVDVTEKQRFEVQLRQTARLESIGVLAGGIAHDFNNLLTGILGNASLLEEFLDEGTLGRDLVNEIVKASESAADLTRQILAYAGKGNFVVLPVDLGQVALGSRPFVRRFTPPYVELIFENEPNLPLVEADAAQMKQVIMNLIINAAESFEDGARGVVHVSTSCLHLKQDFFHPGEDAAPGDYVLLQVSDTGSGMDDATKARIFDPFFTTKFTGRGLGLSAVHGILKAHRGILRLRTAPGTGTCFQLYFPASDSRPNNVMPEQNTYEPARAEAAGTILVIDDEEIVRTFTKAALETRGYRVLMAENGSAGVDLFREMHSEIRAVVLDLTMPQMDGAETFDQIRQIAPDACVILSSGYSESVAAQKFPDKGLAGFLAKPYTARQLATAVNRALSEERNLQERDREERNQ